MKHQHGIGPEALPHQASADSKTTERFASREERGSCHPPASKTSCAHGRLIDDILNNDGTRTGRVRCLECDASFDDPDHGLQ